MMSGAAVPVLVVPEPRGWFQGRATGRLLGGWGEGRMRSAARPGLPRMWFCRRGGHGQGFPRWRAGRWLLRAIAVKIRKPRCICSRVTGASED